MLPSWKALNPRASAASTECASGADIRCGPVVAAEPASIRALISVAETLRVFGWIGHS